MTQYINFGTHCPNGQVPHKILRGTCPNGQSTFNRPRRRRGLLALDCPFGQVPLNILWGTCPFGQCVPKLIYWVICLFGQPIYNRLEQLIRICRVTIQLKMRRPAGRCQNLSTPLTLPNCRGPEP